MIAGAGAFFVKSAAAAELWLQKGTHQPNTLEVNEKCADGDKPPSNHWEL